MILTTNYKLYICVCESHKLTTKIAVIFYLVNSITWIFDHFARGKTLVFFSNFNSIFLQQGDDEFFVLNIEIPIN